MALICLPVAQVSPPVMVKLGTSTTIVARDMVAGRSTLFDKALATTYANSILYLDLGTTEGLRCDIVRGLNVARVYFYFIQTGTVDYKLGWTNANDGTYGEKSQYDLESLISLYLLGATIRDVGFQDAVMDVLLKIYTKKQESADNGSLERVLTNNNIALVYQSTRKGSPMRQFMVENQIWLKKQVDPACATEWFLRDLARTLEQRTSAYARTDEHLIAAQYWMGKYKHMTASHTATGPAMDACYYHEHGPGVDCANKKRKRALEDDAGRT